MHIKSGDYRVGQGSAVELKKWPTLVAPVYKTNEQYQDLLSKHVKALSAQQEMLYASDRYAVLLIFQAMDAAGKDGAIEHVMSGVNPQGCQVFSFKHPSAIELKHDFLDLERHLDRNGTRIIKFFLHLSKDEQRKRFLDRIDRPEKNWKFSLADIEERKYWKDYMRAYEKCIAATSTKYAPWYVVPADDKLNTRLIVSRIVLDTLEALELSYPKTSAARRRELLSLRKKLAK
jgi:polyphosphate kinase 2 (PPK2 family)